MHENPRAEIAFFLENLAISDLNEMQLAFIENAKTANDLMLLAPTGSGKTLAFLIPLIQSLSQENSGVQALIIAPSRELSLQIEQVFKAMKTSFKVSCCYGGHSVKIEQNSLNEAPALIIGTPGRLADHIKRESFDPKSIKLVVLDEFDKALQFGFHEQLRSIFHALDGTQRHLLTSATKLSRFPDFLPFSRPEILNYLKDGTASKLELKLIKTSSLEKAETLMRLVASFNNESCLVFCNHRDAVNRISTLLTDHEFEHGVLHGGLEQIDREKNLIKFRGGAYNLLIATDLASRGLDIPEIKHVVHYQIPFREEPFIHRNGRTARMHAEGQGYIVLANDEDLPEYIDKVVEEITVNPLIKLPPPPFYACMYISAGKRDKISKGDILGLIIQKGGLLSSEIGLITVLDFSSYVAIKRDRIVEVLNKIKHEKLKKIKVKFDLAN